MNLRAAFLARSAKANGDGTFDVEGGGVDMFHLRGGLILGAPIELQFAVVLRLELDENEIEQLMPVNMEVIFEGQPVTNAMLPLLGRKVPGETHYHHNAVLNVRIQVPRPGSGSLRFSWDAGLASIPALYFRVGAPPSA